jgi:hypothetical protein
MRGKTTTIIAVTALVVACLAATPVGQAAGKFVLGKNSVGTKQLKKNAVTGVKVKNGSLMAADFRQGQLPAGPQGPKGPQGDTGAQGLLGLPGTARAYGRVDKAGNLTRSKNVASVTHADTGLYCIELAAGIDIEGTGVVATPDYNGDDTHTQPNGSQAFVEYSSGPGGCPPGQMLSPHSERWSTPPAGTSTRSRTSGPTKLSSSSSRNDWEAAVSRWRPVRASVCVERPAA